MTKEELEKTAILARLKVNLDPDVIRLWTKYHDKVQKLDNAGNKKEGDELEKEWQCIFIGFVQLFLPRDLSDEDYDYIVDYVRQ